MNFSQCLYIFLVFVTTFDMSTEKKIVNRLNSTCYIRQKIRSRTNLLDPNKLWKDGRVYYKFDLSFNERDRRTFYDAINQFHTQTCIRWVPRRSEPGYVVVATDHNATCASAHACYLGTEQRLHNSPRCYYITDIIHEMLHTLCFLHEQQRLDRDEFIDFTGCPPDQILPIIPMQTNYGGIYDYYSQTHYQCVKGTCSGYPKLPSVIRCGAGVNTEGLSVLDVDKLNHVYDCQGCHSHRWYNLQNLTSGDQRWNYLLNFAPPGNPPVYVCRSHTQRGGEISTGLFRGEWGLCQLTWWGQVHNVTRHIQVLALPGGPYDISTNTSKYYLAKFKRHDTEQVPFYVPIGRDIHNKKIFLAIRAGDKNGLHGNTIVGKYYDNWAMGVFIDPYLNNDEQQMYDDFFVLACRIPE